MLKNSALSGVWGRQVFLRNPSRELDANLSMHAGSSGIYLVGCFKEIVYVGQSWHLGSRSIESLGNIYHRVADTSLPWSIAFAPCPTEEMNERESTAIRSYAPRFNKSIPSIYKSEGRMPEVVGIAAVFQDQDGSCAAFAPENLTRQMEIAEANPTPPWKAKKRCKKTAKRVPKYTTNHTIPLKWPNEHKVDLLKAYGVPLSEPPRFKVNLCDNGSVVTEDGEIIGMWQMDENAHPSFFPNGSSEPLFFDLFVGLLCKKIREWLEANTGEAISENRLEQPHLTGPV